MGILKNDNEHGTDFDRRSFLKGAAIAGAAALGGAALAGCSPAQPSSQATAADAASADGGASAAKVSGSIGGALCQEDWLGEMPVVDPADISETRDFDVVVLGAGHAGAQAALAAAEEGVSVAVVETQPEETYSCNGDDIATYNSNFVVSQGYGPYDLGDVTAEYVRRGNGRVNIDVIKTFVDNSGEMLDNMIDNYIPETSDMFDQIGVNFVIQHAHNKEDGSYYPLVVSGFKNWATTVQTAGTTNSTPVFGREGLSRLTEFDLYALQGAQDQGAEMFWGTSAYSLVLDGDAVVGAIVKDMDGNFIQLNASKGVILCTGDFSSNTDMVYNLLDEVAEWGTLAGEDRADMGGFGRDGMGHKLACWAGGAMEPHPRPTMDGGMPGAWGTTPFLFLNSQGDRFMNEAMAQMIGEQFLRSPQGNINIITDSKFMQTIEQVGCDHGAPNWGNPDQVYAMQAAVEAMAPGPDGANIPSTDVVSLVNKEKEDFGGGPGTRAPTATLQTPSRSFWAIWATKARR